jgi:hypothetical protein
MIDIQAQKAIPGVFISGTCYYNALGVDPPPHTSSALGFSVDSGCQFLFQKPNADEQRQHHQM